MFHGEPNCIVIYLGSHSPLATHSPTISRVNRDPVDFLLVPSPQSPVPNPQSPVKVTYAQISSAGPVRPNNEDWVAFWEPGDEQEYRTRGAVAALADGVGGHGEGEVASRLAVETALRRFQELKPNTAARQALWQMFSAANTAVYDRSMFDREQGRMATTLTIAIFRNNEIDIGHVGDCRAVPDPRGQDHADHEPITTSPPRK